MKSFQEGQGKKCKDWPINYRALEEAIKTQYVWPGKETADTFLLLPLFCLCSRMIDHSPSFRMVVLFYLSILLSGEKRHGLCLPGTDSLSGEKYHSFHKHLLVCNKEDTIEICCVPCTFTSCFLFSLDSMREGDISSFLYFEDTINNQLSRALGHTFSLQLYVQIWF